MKKRIILKRKSKSLSAIENYPMVSCEWNDIESFSGWCSIKDLQNSKLPKCITKGHLISQKNGITRIFGDYSIDSNNEINEIGNTTIIPNCVIVSIKKI
jgi:hypothetical protein